MFLFFMLSCITSLYVFDILNPSQIDCLQISSHSAGGLFVLLIASFTVQELFSVMWYHLSISAFVSLP